MKLPTSANKTNSFKSFGIIFAAMCLLCLNLGANCLPVVNGSSVARVKQAPQEDTDSENWPEKLESPGQPGSPVDVDSLIWRRKVNNILSAKLGTSKQINSRLVVNFLVQSSGTISEPVTFSPALEDEQSKEFTKKIMSASPLPSIPGKKSKKVAFEILEHGKTFVDFAK